MKTEIGKNQLAILPGRSQLPECKKLVHSQAQEQEIQRC